MARCYRDDIRWPGPARTRLLDQRNFSETDSGVRRQVGVFAWAIAHLHLPNPLAQGGTLVQW